MGFYRMLVILYMLIFLIIYFGLVVALTYARSIIISHKYVEQRYFLFSEVPTVDVISSL